MARRLKSREALEDFLSKHAKKMSERTVKEKGADSDEAKWSEDDWKDSIYDVLNEHGTEFDTDEWADAYEDFEEDTDGDGDKDTVISDTDGNGKPDTAVVDADSAKEEETGTEAAVTELVENGDKSELQQLRDAYPELNEIPDEELLEALNARDEEEEDEEEDDGGDDEGEDDVCHGCGKSPCECDKNESMKNITGALADMRW